MKGFTKAYMLSGLLAVGLGGMALSAPVAADEVVVIRNAPPPPRFEHVPPPRPGFVWAPGYWRWDGYRHVWVSGYWIRERPGWHYHPGVWVQRGPGWHYHPGYWVR